MKLSAATVLALLTVSSTASAEENRVLMPKSAKAAKSTNGGAGGAIGINDVKGTWCGPCDGISWDMGSAVADEYGCIVTFTDGPKPGTVRGYNCNPDYCDDFIGRFLPDGSFYLVEVRKNAFINGKLENGVLSLIRQEVGGIPSVRNLSNLQKEDCTGYTLTP